MCWSDCDRRRTEPNAERGTRNSCSDFRVPTSALLFLRRERQGHPVGPAEPVLRGILAAAGAPPQVHDVVLLRHLARRAIGPPVHGEPAIAGGIRQVRAPVAAHAFDREPLEWGPPVGRVPLLT